MRLAGMRFWTWMIVAAISFFVKSEGGALPQQETPNKKSSSTRFKHNVPAGSHSKTMLLQDKRKDNNNPAVSSIGKGEQKKWIGKEGGPSTIESQRVGTDYTRHKKGSGSLNDNPTESSKTLKSSGQGGSKPNPTPLTHRRQH
jgi:hypothetical protein